jgi:O-antigen/teichoic acid export membrane protein
VLKVLLTLMAGETSARAVHIVGFLLLARLAGKEALGQFGFAFAVSSYLLLLVLQALDTVAIRDVSRDRQRLNRYAAGIMGLRLVSAAVILCLVLGYVMISDRRSTESLLLAIFSITFITGSLSLKWVFQALERPQPIAISGIVTQVCFLAGVLAVRRPSDIVWPAAALVFGEVTAAAILWFAVRRTSGPIRPAVDVALWKDFMKDSWPMSVCIVLGNLLYNFDVLALRWYGYRAELGVYIACYRCVSMATLVLGLVQTSVFPAVSRTYPNRGATIAMTRRLSLYCGAGMVLPSLVLTALAPLILTILYGAAYQEGATILRVLAWTLPVQGVRTILRLVLFAYHRQRQDMYNILGGVITNMVLDLTLIPRWGPVACAWSTVCAEVVVLAATYLAWHRAVRSARPLPQQAASASA